MSIITHFEHLETRNLNREHTLLIIIIFKLYIYKYNAIAINIIKLLYDYFFLKL